MRIVQVVAILLLAVLSVSAVDAARSEAQIGKHICTEQFKADLSSLFIQRVRIICEVEKAYAVGWTSAVLFYFHFILCFFAFNNRFGVAGVPVRF